MDAAADIYVRVALRLAAGGISLVVALSVVRRRRRLCRQDYILAAGLFALLLAAELAAMLWSAPEGFVVALYAAAYAIVLGAAVVSLRRGLAGGVQALAGRLF